MTDIVSEGVKTEEDTNCIYKVNLPKDNEAGFTIQPPVPDTVYLSYFIETKKTKTININGDVAYHPKRILTILQTDCNFTH